MVRMDAGGEACNGRAPEPGWREGFGRESVMRGLVASIVAAVLAAPLLGPVLAGEADEAREPPMEFTIELDGRPAAIQLDRPLAVTPTTVSTVTLRVAPTRRLRLRDLTLRYPRHYTFEYDPDGNGTWTLSGTDHVITITRASAGASADQARMRTAAAIARAYQESGRSVKAAPVSRHLAAHDLTGTRVTLSVGETRIRQEIYGLKTREGAYILTLQDTGDGSDEGRGAMALLDESLRWIE
jgi:hypothetical protein